MITDKIKQMAQIADKEIPESMLTKLRDYADFVVEWNDKVNLVSRKDTENMFEQHIAPCLCYYLLNMFTEEDHKIVDIGSGGGFPGIINAITHPDKEFLLVDARQKKIKILQEAITQLKLENCTAVWGRCEDVSKSPKYAKQYDVCTSRGVGAMKVIIPLSLPFLKPNGIMLAMKGGDMIEEFKGIKKRNRFQINEFEMDERFHYIERYQTLKLVELGKAE